MKTLVIYAHPNTKGHCSTILEEVEKSLKSKSISYEVIDLYKIKYDPVLAENELYTAGRKDISKQNKEFQNKISESEKLIFIYPNWWNNMPAILKGFIDRVLTSGFAFKYVNRRPIGLLKGKKAAIFISTGAPLFFYKLMERSVASNLMKKYLLGFCGISSKAFIVGNANQLNDKQIEKIKCLVKKGIDYLYG